MKNSNITAFSLIEISIVLLIIGILIAGVTQASRMLNSSALSSARTLTASAPVNGVKDLLLWLEATSESSFLSTEMDNNLNLSRWNDLNPQASVRNNVTKTASSDVVFKTSGIGNLPAVYFGGNTSANAFFTGTVLSASSNKYTVFIVYQGEDNSSSSWRTLFINGASNGFSFQKGGGSNAAIVNKRCFTFSTVIDNCSTSDLSTSKEIMSMVYDGSYQTMYINGVQESLANAGPYTMGTPTTSLRVGGTSGAITSWKGYVGEIIVYGNALKSADRQEIEQYLSKKWRIGITQS